MTMTVTLSDTLLALLPTEAETLLLRACLLSEEAGREAWCAWQEEVGDPHRELASGRPVLSHFLPLLHVATQGCRAQVEPDLAVLFRAAYFREELRSHTLLQVLKSVLLALHDVGVHPLVLKGAALAGTVYESWPLRHCHDIDLLVDQGAVQRASQALREAGLASHIEFSPRSQGSRLLHPSQLPIELHAHLFEAPGYRHGAAGMIARCLRLDLDGIASSILSPADMLLHVCGHASYSPSRLGLRWVTDAWFLIERTPTLDWEKLLHAAGESNLALPLLVMLRYLHSELELAIPGSVLDALARRANRLSRSTREVALLGLRGNTRQARLATRSWRSRLFLFRWRAIPTPSFLRSVYDIDSRRQLLRLYLQRPIRYVARRCGIPVHRFREARTSGEEATYTSMQRPWEPSEDQLPLLRSAVFHDRRATDAWRDWKKHRGTQKIDGGSSALLPIIYRNLSALGVEDPQLDPARLAYQMTWLANQKLFRNLASLLRSLQAAGIDVMALKGTALALLYYRDEGRRSLGDVDILVRPQDVRQAVDLLGSGGWRQMGKAPRNLTETYLGARRAINFTGGGIEKLDLHWHVMMECCRPGGDDLFWSGAGPIEVSGAEVLAMNPTDQLLHVCAHETRWTPSPMPRWIVDVVAILETPDVRIDWDRFVEHTRWLDLVIPVREALECVLRTAEAPIPESVLKALHAVPASKRSRRDYEARRRPPGHNPLRRIALEYRRMCLLFGSTGLCLRFWAFPGYVRSLWGLDSVWQLPLHLLRWAVGFVVRSGRHAASTLLRHR